MLKIRSRSCDSGKEARRPTPLERRPRSWIDWITQPRRGVRSAFRWTILASLSLHLALAPLKPRENGLSPDQEKMFQTEYQKKVEAAKSARVISRELSNKATMPPPPPDPEAVVAKTLSDSLTSD